VRTRDQRPAHSAGSSVPAELTAIFHMPGRLDANTTGLLCANQRGSWSHGLPRQEWSRPKTYQVALSAPISQAQSRLWKPAWLRNDTKATKAPLTVRCWQSQASRADDFEGRYHQVKRMCRRCNHVTTLHSQPHWWGNADPALACRRRA